MSLEIVPIRKEHLEDAAKLVSIRYGKLLEQIPSLPARYADVNVAIAHVRGKVSQTADF